MTSARLGRIPLRWLLPVFGILLFGGLWWSAVPGGLETIPSFTNPLPVLEYYIPFQRRLAIAINAPANWLTLIPMAIAGINEWRTSPAEQIAVYVPGMLISVGIVWFLTGVWFDRRRGLLPNKPKRRPNLRLTGIVLLGILQVLVFVQSIYFLTGGIAGWHGETPVMAANTYGMAAWITLWQYMAVSSWLRSRWSAQRVSTRARRPTAEG